MRMKVPSTEDGLSDYRMFTTLSSKLQASAEGTPSVAGASRMLPVHHSWIRCLHRTVQHVFIDADSIRDDVLI